MNAPLRHPHPLPSDDGTVDPVRLCDDPHGTAVERVVRRVMTGADIDVPGRAPREAVRAEAFAWPLSARGPAGEALTIRAVRLLHADDAGEAGGPPRRALRRAVVLSAGLHGAEGPFGAAVLSVLAADALRAYRPAPGTGVVVLPCLNPWGYAHHRRVDEDNVDLNRNFLPAGEDYAGSPPHTDTAYAAFDPVIAPMRWGQFTRQAIPLLLKIGLYELRRSLPAGQYDRPSGLFFGGKRPSGTMRVLTGAMPVLLGDAPGDVLHLDWHSGLGPWAEYRMLLDDAAGTGPARWWQAWAARHAASFGAELVEPVDHGGTAYALRGGFGRWCEAAFPRTRYRFGTAECGTYHALRVMSSLVAEMRAWNHGGPAACEGRFAWARRDLRESFVPASTHWRRKSVTDGVRLAEAALAWMAAAE